LNLHDALAQENNDDVRRIVVGVSGGV